jgi:hypothetical protein
VYYTYTPTRLAYTLFEIEQGNYDTVLSLHSGCPATAANTIACDDDSGTGSLSKITGLLAQAGVPIIVRVSGFNTRLGEFTLRVSEMVPPNDTCQNAVPLTANVLVNSSSVAAGNEGAADCAIGGHDVYYSFTPTCTGSYTLDTFGGMDTVASIHTGCPATLANLIACNDDSRDSRLSSITATLNAGATYTIRIAGYNNTDGAFGVKMTNLSTVNDECPQATSISLGTTAFNNCAAGPTTFESVCSAFFAHDLWYRVISTNSEVPLTISTAGSTFDTILVMYSACPANGGVPLACSDDFGGTYQSILRAAVPAGGSVWVRVGGYGGQSGAGQLVVTQCLADLAGAGAFPDGIIDGNDFIAFINSFGIGNVAESSLADVNGDGIIDGNDFVAFINSFAAGC